MSFIAGILMNIVSSLAATALWVFLGVSLLRKKRYKKKVAFWRLYIGLDRLKDSLQKIKSVLIKEQKGSNHFTDLIKNSEASLERYVVAINYEWIVENIPYKSQKSEIKWMPDLDYILDTYREMVNELNSLSLRIKRKGTLC